MQEIKKSAEISAIINLICKVEYIARKEDTNEKREVMRLIREAVQTGEIDPVILQDAILCIE